VFYREVRLGEILRKIVCDSVRGSSFNIDATPWADPAPVFKKYREGEVFGFDDGMKMNMPRSRCAGNFNNVCPASDFDSPE